MEDIEAYKHKGKKKATSKKESNFYFSSKTVISLVNYLFQPIRTRAKEGISKVLPTNHKFSFIVQNCTLQTPSYMKIRRNIYLVTGIILIVLNSLVTYSMYQNFELALNDKTNSVFYMIGNQAFTIIGLFLLLGAYRVQRKINRKKRQALENSFVDTADNQ